MEESFLYFKIFSGRFGALRNLTGRPASRARAGPPPETVASRARHLASAPPLGPTPFRAHLLTRVSQEHPLSCKLYRSLQCSLYSRCRFKSFKRRLCTIVPIFLLKKSFEGGFGHQVSCFQGEKGHFLNAATV